MGVLITIAFGLLGGLLYRLGGKEGWNTRVRDAGVPLVFAGFAFYLHLIHGLWGVLALLVSMGIMWGALTTYRYFLPKPKDYDWYHYAMHGFFVAASVFPLAYVSGNWLGFGIRCVSCAALLGGWYFIGKVDDDLHEGGRGFFLIVTTQLLRI